MFLDHAKVAFGEHPLTAFLVIAIAFVELPTGIIGRTLGLPIETGEPAFLLYCFTPLGYFLTIIIWALMGAVIGWCVEKLQNRQ